MATEVLGSKHIIFVIFTWKSYTICYVFVVLDI